jgi:xanthine dehydrogenase YagR molybdenum-binding subunit
VLLVLSPGFSRSQLVGAMTMGLGMALLKESVLDPCFGDYINSDLASYPVPVNADVEELDAAWIDEHDPLVNPIGRLARLRVEVRTQA